LKRALYPGTFDPITNGHLDIVERALQIFDEIVVAVGEGYEKAPLFSIAERVEMIKESTAELPGVEVTSFTGLLVDFATEQGVDAVVRGLRFLSDFEYEFQMALMNRRLEPRLETVFLMPSEQFTYLNSTVIKEIAQYGGRLEGLVPDCVARMLVERYGNKSR
jgi:pantetheine-phosphate adenylyltransferase